MRRISKPRDLLEPRNLRLCRAMKRCPLHTGNVEALHARNQAQNHINSGWATLVARFMLSQGRMNVKQYDLSQKAVRDALSALAVNDNDISVIRTVKSLQDKVHHEEGSSKALALQDSAGELLAGHSKLQVCYHWQLKQLAVRGLKRPPLKQFWKDVSQKLKEMSNTNPEQVARFNAIAKHNASKSRKHAHGETAQRLTEAEARTRSSGPCGPRLSLTDASEAMDVSRDPLTCIPCCTSETALQAQSQELRLPTLKLTSVCPSCGVSGKHHPQPEQRLDIVARYQTREYREFSVLPTATGTASPLSATPLAVEQYAAERQLWKGKDGLRGLCRAFSRGTESVGRDTGGIPPNMPRLKRCGALCLTHATPEVKSLVGKMKACFGQVITACGGLTELPNRMPSPSNLLLNSNMNRHFNESM